MISHPALRLLAARIVGILAGFYAILMLVALAPMNWVAGGFNIPFILFCAFYGLLLIAAFGTMLARYWARLALSILMSFMICWQFVFFLISISSFPQSCAVSCYVNPLENAAFITVPCLIATWVVYPRRAERLAR
jgi:hypothetical protein